MTAQPHGTNPNRVPSGVPAGGQFSTARKTESDVTLLPSAFAQPLDFAEVPPTDPSHAYYTTVKACPACDGDGAFRAASDRPHNYDRPETCPACEGAGELTAGRLDFTIDQYAMATEDGRAPDWAYGNEILADYAAARYVTGALGPEEPWPGQIDGGPDSEPPF